MTSDAATTIPASADERLKRVAGICLALPEAAASTRTGQHYAFQVRNKTFLYYLADHHGDGRTAVCFKAPAGMAEILTDNAAARFYRAAYLSQHGWVCLDLEAAELDWDEVREFLVESYCLIAPKRLAATALSAASQHSG